MLESIRDRLRQRIPLDWSNGIAPFDPAIPVREEVQREKFKGFEIAVKWLVSALGRAPDSGWTVLEAGHGSTGYARYYAQLFDRVYGIDLKDYSLFHPGVTSLVGDLTQNVPLDPGSVDLAVSHSVLEHVADVPAVLKSIDRVLKRDGYAFITVYGLYFSPEGSHVRTSDLHYRNWEHLDPGSPHYLLRASPNSKVTKAAYLNGARMSDYLAALGSVPWDIVRLSRSYDEREIPEYVDRGQFDELDLRTRGFKLLARKTRGCPKTD